MAPQNVVPDLLSSLESSHASSTSLSSLTSEMSSSRTIHDGDFHSSGVGKDKSNKNNNGSCSNISSGDMDDNGSNNKSTPELRLILSQLNRVPQQIRFGVAGFLSNVVFMVWYNIAVTRFERYYAASTIYAVTYLFFIPVSHALMSCIVFGWPSRYWKSLLNNAPIGLTSIVLGSACTAYLDKIGFQVMAEEWIQYWVSGEAAGRNLEDDSPATETSGEFYSSLVVMLITGVWSYFLAVFINAPPEAPGTKKEL